MRQANYLIEIRIIAQRLKHAVEDEPAFVAVEGMVLKMSDGMKDVKGKIANSSKNPIAKDIPKSGGRRMQENGKAFEEFLVRQLGGKGSFKVGGREFDGAIGNIWYEAKSGAYWEGLLASEKRLSTFKSTTCDCLKIAKDHNALFEIHSNSPIPQPIKDWLIKKQIHFTEWL